MLFTSLYDITISTYQELKEVKNDMIRIKNHKQLSLFDPFESISPKRRKMLKKSWAGPSKSRKIP